jgi:hypothetical protein
VSGYRKFQAHSQNLECGNCIPGSGNRGNLEKAKEARSGRPLKNRRTMETGVSGGVLPGKPGEMMPAWECLSPSSVKDVRLILNMARDWRSGFFTPNSIEARAPDQAPFFDGSSCPTK